MCRSATLPSPISRPRPEAPYNAACVRGPAAELTPQEIRENAVSRGSRSEEAARFVDIGSEKTALAAAFRRHGFGSRSIRRGSPTRWFVTPRTTSLGAGRSDTVPRLARQIPHAKISLGAGRSATVLRHRKDSVDIMACFGTGRFVTVPQRHELISRLRSMPKAHRPPSASSMVGMRRSRSRTSRTLDAPLALPLLRCRFVTVGPDLGRNA